MARRRVAMTVSHSQQQQRDYISDYEVQLLQDSITDFVGPFNPEQHALEFFRTHHESDVKRRMQDLTVMKGQVEEVLRRKVTDNYKIFMHATKEVNRMSNEISELKSVVTDTKDAFAMLMQCIETPAPLHQLQSQILSPSTSSSSSSSASLALTNGTSSSSTARKPATTPSSNGPISSRGGGGGEAQVPPWLLNAPRDIEIALIEQQLTHACVLVTRVRKYMHMVSATINLGPSAHEAASKVESLVSPLAHRLVSRIKAIPSFGLFSPIERYRPIALLVELGLHNLATQAFSSTWLSIAEEALTAISTLSVQGGLSGQRTHVPPLAQIQTYSRVFFSHLADAVSAYVQIFGVTGDGRKELIGGGVDGLIDSDAIISGVLGNLAPSYYVEGSVVGGGGTNGASTPPPSSSSTSSAAGGNKGTAASSSRYNNTNGSNQQRMNDSASRFGGSASQASYDLGSDGGGGGGDGDDASVGDDDDLSPIYSSHLIAWVTSVVRRFVSSMSKQLQAGCNEGSIGLCEVLRGRLNDLIDAFDRESGRIKGKKLVMMGGVLVEEDSDEEDDSSSTPASPPPHSMTRARGMSVARQHSNNDHDANGHVAGGGGGSGMARRPSRRESTNLEARKLLASLRNTDVSSSSGLIFDIDSPSAEVSEMFQSSSGRGGGGTGSRHHQTHGHDSSSSSSQSSSASGRRASIFLRGGGGGGGGLLSPTSLSASSSSSALTSLALSPAGRVTRLIELAPMTFLGVSLSIAMMEAKRVMYATMPEAFPLLQHQLHQHHFSSSSSSSSSQQLQPSPSSTSVSLQCGSLVSWIIIPDLTSCITRHCELLEREMVEVIASETWQAVRIAQPHVRPLPTQTLACVAGTTEDAVMDGGGGSSPTSSSSVMIIVPDYLHNDSSSSPSSISSPSSSSITVAAACLDHCAHTLSAFMIDAWLLLNPHLLPPSTFEAFAPRYGTPPPSSSSSSSSSSTLLLPPYSRGDVSELEPLVIARLISLITTMMDAITLRAKHLKDTGVDPPIPPSSSSSSSHQPTSPPSGKYSAEQHACMHATIQVIRDKTLVSVQRELGGRFGNVKGSALVKAVMAATSSSSSSPNQQQQQQHQQQKVLKHTQRLSRSLVESSRRCEDLIASVVGRPKMTASQLFALVTPPSSSSPPGSASSIATGTNGASSRGTSSSTSGSGGTIVVPIRRK